MITILDAYTDEAAGLGVPPYLGTYPRYIYGYYKLKREEIKYITIDDLRLLVQHGNVLKETKGSQKTNIYTYNLTRNSPKIRDILENTDKLIVICGVHVPGKYLSAQPGTLREISGLLKKIDRPFEMILTGPAITGTQLHGGKFAEKADISIFNEVKDYYFSYEDLKEIAPLGAGITDQIGSARMIEIETGKGCRGKCSFCTEPLKSPVEFRNKEDILKEVKAFCDRGHNHIRLGKQTCYYSHPEAVGILKGIREQNDIKILHIDNVNPVKVVADKDHEITKAIVKYCTSGNIAAFGVETFDPEVAKANMLNCKPETAYEAVKIINKYGREYGENGMPKFLPGINLIFGLIGESKKTQEHNMRWLKRFLEEDLWMRRINIRQAAIMPGTMLEKEAGNKFLRKNKKYYWKWRNEIRQNIDLPMLQKVLPIGHVLKDVRMEIYDGKTTFGRQLGTYPLVIGVKGRLELGKYYDINVKKHMLRSIEGEILNS